MDDDPDLSANPSFSGKLTDVPDVAVGHWSDPVARTGCTVVVLPEGTVASAEVRGGAPASRELALCEPTRTVGSIDALVLTGGSAFGLAAADGVMGHLETVGRGFPTPAGRVPIVPALALFDLDVGDATVRPDAAAGLAAARAARSDGHEIGLVGAGTGCTIDHWPDAERTRPGGLVAASAHLGAAVVAALIAVNAAGTVGADATYGLGDAPHPLLGTNTTIGVVVTSASLDKVGCHLLAQSAHDGLARAIFPAHTRFDGDAFVACATGGSSDAPDGQADPGIDALRAATCAVVERAIRTLVPAQG